MKAMKLKSCFLLIGLLLVCNVYAQELCRADFLPKASAAFDLLTQKYSEERIVKEIRAKNVRWVTNLMSASAVFYKATHEKRYLDMSEQVSNRIPIMLMFKNSSFLNDIHRLKF